MAISLATTTIAVLRTPPADDADPYDAPAEPVTVAEGVRAHIGSPRGYETQRGGSQVAITNSLGCDPVDLDPATDQVRDETTNALYDVEWADQRLGNGLDHTAAGLVRVKGVV